MKKKSNSRRSERTPRSVIGWREWCALPDLALPGVLAKIDTGAKTSSLHAFDIVELEDYPGWLRFSIHPVQRHRRPVIQCKAPQVDSRKVISSNGSSELRPVISTTVQLGFQSFNTEITLTNRDEMGFRMLIGRKALNRRFIVDPALSYCCGDREEGDMYPGQSQE